MMYNELAHHGIKGMKWGVRRTEKQLAKIRKRAEKEGWSEEATKARSKSAKSMTTSELKEAIARLDMEKRYNDLRQNDITSGQKFVASSKKVLENRAKDVGNVAVNVAKNTAQNIGTQALTYYIGKKVNQATNKKTGENWVNPRKGQKDK